MKVATPAMKLDVRINDVRAEEGLLTYRKGLDQRAALIPELTTVDVPGGHHCHLDGDTTPVSDAIKRFLFDV